MSNDQRYSCGCPCHGGVVVHPTPICGCGRSLTPPVGCGPTSRPTCTPPPRRAQPGTVDVPQPTAPPIFHTSATPTPDPATKPPAGDPGEGPWFAAGVNGILRKGPQFGLRKDEFLPNLFIRSAPGDRGKRTLSGVFWESPDIMLAPGQDADTAPLMPTNFGGVTQANLPTTLYAHVWNSGRAAAHGVQVEFWSFLPRLGGLSEGMRIGTAVIDLADRFSTDANWAVAKNKYGTWMSKGNHAIVRCPKTWVPTYENHGHECLIVRVSEPILDAVGRDEFRPVKDRRVAQRNIAVVEAASPAAIDLALQIGYPDAPGDIEVDVTLDPPASMPWLHLFAGTRGMPFALPTTPVIAGFLPPTAAGTRVPPLSQVGAEGLNKLLRQRERFAQGCCPLQVVFHASAADLGPSQAQVLRVRQRVGGEVVGGYTVVLLKR